MLVYSSRISVHREKHVKSSVKSVRVNSLRFDFAIGGNMV